MTTSDRHRRKPRLPMRASAAAALALLACSGPALAVDYVWQGGGGQWLDAGKWTLLGVPGSGDTATINFTSTGAVDLNSTQSVDRLTMNGGKLGGAGILNAGSLVFNGGSLGATAFGPGGTVNVAGNTTINGTGSQQVDWSQTLNLNGNSTWSAGNGWLGVAGAYSSGNSSYPGAVLRIASGTTFADLGAASSSGYKVLGGGNGTIRNDGVYTRTGAGGTWLRGLVNTGTVNVDSGIFGFDTGNWLNTSSGQINVAQGAELQVAALTLSAGSIHNAGKITVIGNSSEVQAAAAISGNWQMDAGTLAIQGTQRIGSLVLNGGTLNGQGTLTVDTLSFNAGKLTNPSFQTGSQLIVQGSASFDGRSVLSIDNSAQLHLQGNGTWSAGNGWLGVAGAYSSGNSSYAAALLHIGSGTTFTDLGAAGNDGYKVLGGGSHNVLNDGTYNRNGLGTTWVRGLNNAGTLNVNAGTLGFDTSHWLNTSSGQVNVAQGAQLLLAYTTLTAGALNNAGLVTVIGGDNRVQAAASISGNWQIDRGQLIIESTQRIGTLTINGGTITGQGTLTVDALSFQSGTLANGSFLTGSRLNVQGSTSFDGSSNQQIGNSAQLHLLGNSVWTAGNGRLSVDSAYSAGSNSYPAALLRITAGTTFTDQGAASSAGFKVLGGGTVRNEGTLLRTGLGSTEVRGLDNVGLVDVAEGALEVNANFSNTGTLTVRAGAVLHGLSGPLQNAGVLSGDGTVRTASLSTALANAGTLTPGGLGSTGSLLLDGDLAMASSGVLRIDLAGGAHDLLTITSDASFAGTLQLWAAPGTALQVGDSFVVATYGQRLAGSSFGSVQWLGAGANPFSVEYGAHDLTLRVTSAVPEPASWALMAAGGLLLAARRRAPRRRPVPA